MRTTCFAVLIFAVFTGATACGGESANNAPSAPSECGEVAACGGDLVGDWTVIDSCSDNAALSDLLASSGATMTCPDVEVESTSVSTSGSVHFGADLTYSMELMVSGSARVFVPASCFTVGQLKLTCDQLSSVLTDSASGSVQGIGSFACNDATDGCSCSVGIAPQPRSDSGTYVLSETDLTLSGATTQALSYCVKGSQLHLLGGDANTTAGASSGIGDMVANKH